MARLDLLTDDDYSTGSSSSEDDLFDEDEAFCSGTEATDVELLDANDGDGVEDDDSIEDQILKGNVHPPEYYQRGEAEFDEDADDDDDGYCTDTRKQLDRIEEQWTFFCIKVLKREPKECFQSVSLGRLRQFFEWLLNQKVGKGGRKKKGTKKKSSLGTDWKQFRLVYERATSEKLDPKLNRRMHKVLRKLATEHKLSSQRRKNRCMTIDSLKDQVETTLSTTEKSFELGEIRILAALFLLLLAPAGSRPQSILRLRFGDIRVVLSRDPEGGPHNIMVKFTLEFTKTYLGAKDANTIPLPETMFDPSLLLSHHVFLLGILFRHRAFREPELVSPRQLDSLDIHPDELELRIPLRRDLHDVCLFRRAVRTLTGYDMSPTQPITYAMMAAWTKKVGEIMGLEIGTIPYNLRYNAGNEFDQSGSVSDALRNLMLGHANSNPFQKHYLGREICADPWALLRGRTPQQALVKQSCSVAHSISKRRPLNLTAEQSASVLTHPLVRKLTSELRGLPQDSARYLNTRRKLRNAKQTLRRELRERIRDEWTDEQAVDDIRRQLRGIGFAEPIAADAARRPQLPAQKRLVAALTAPVETTVEGHYRRRDNAIEAVTAYCVVQEGRTVRRAGTTSAAVAAPSAASEPPQDSPVILAATSVFVKDEKERPRRCFLCVGAALAMEPDHPLVEDLIHEFYTPSDLSKHFRRKHLKVLAADAKPECPVCDIALSHKMHLQNHALLVHGTVS